jgi:hypothetical protein
LSLRAISTRCRATKRVRRNGPVPEGAAAKAFHAASAFGARGAGLPSASGLAMNRLVRLIGSRLSGSLVMSATVRSSILLRAAQRRHPRGGEAHLPRVVVRRLAVQHLADVPHHGVGVEVAAVVELHARPQAEHPARLVRLVHLPLGGEAGITTEGLSAADRSQAVSPS